MRHLVKERKMQCKKKKNLYIHVYIGIETELFLLPNY